MWFSMNSGSLVPPNVSDIQALEKKSWLLYFVTLLFIS